MNGIVILGTLPGSSAERLGLRNGDVLLAVNGETMNSVEDFLRVRSATKDAMHALIRRGDRVFEVTMDLSGRASPEGLEQVARDLRSSLEAPKVKPPEPLLN